MKDFDGRIVVIIGGVSGIGLVLVKNCLDCGMNFVLVDI